jgi:hypothetical protein
METHYRSVEKLTLLLKKLNNNKKTRNPHKKIFRVDNILDADTRCCRYAGGQKIGELKRHLQIKFTSPDEKGVICISVLLDKYIEIYS